MVTAANDAPTVDTLLKLGVVDYLVKPFTYERFQQALDNFCRHRDAVAGDAVEQSALDRLFSPALPAGTSRPRASRKHPGACARLPAGGTAPGPAQRSPLPPDRPFSGDGAAVCQLPGRAGEAASAVNYDTGGRPCRLYRCPGPPA